MQRIANLCPDLKRIRILTEDRHLEIFAREASGLKIEELDAHIAWSRESGIKLIKINLLLFLTLYNRGKIKLLFYLSLFDALVVTIVNI